MFALVRGHRQQSMTTWPGQGHVVIDQVWHQPLNIKTLEMAIIMAVTIPLAEGNRSDCSQRS